MSTPEKFLDESAAGGTGSSSAPAEVRPSDEAEESSPDSGGGAGATSAATSSPPALESKRSSGRDNTSGDTFRDMLESVKSHPSVRDMDWVIFPDNKWIRRWDALILCLLLVVAFIIPYQVGVSGGISILIKIWWFVINVLIGVAFFVDMILYFFRAYRDEGGHLVFNLQKIRRRYIRTYLIPNILSSLPTTLLFYGFGTRFLDSKVHPEDSVRYGVQTLVLIKLFDLLKLIRFIRVKAILTSSDIIRELRERQKSYVLDLLKFVFLIVAVSHYFACIWSFVAFMEVGNLSEDLLLYPNWIGNWVAGTYDDPYNIDPKLIDPVGWDRPLDRYVLSLFWAIQTITSIGYGNISPYTRAEWWVGSSLQLLAGIMWAYVIGGLVGVVNSMSGRSQVYKERIDQANDMIGSFVEPTEDGGGDLGKSVLPEEERRSAVIFERKALGKRIRRFITEQRDKSRSDSYNSTLSIVFPVVDTLPPELHLMSSLMFFKPFLDAVPYLSCQYLSNMEQAWVASECQLFDFSCGEILVVKDHVSDVGRGILVVMEGMALAKRSRDKSNRASFILCGGRVFGEDMVLLEDDAAGSQGVINFLTYSKVVFIPRHAILLALEKNQKAWRHSARWLYVKAMVLSGATKKVV